MPSTPSHREKGDAAASRGSLNPGPRRLWGKNAPYFNRKGETGLQAESSTNTAEECCGDSLQGRLALSSEADFVRCECERRQNNKNKKKERRSQWAKRSEREPRWYNPAKIRRTNGDRVLITEREPARSANDTFLFRPLDCICCRPRLRSINSKAEIARVAGDRGQRPLLKEEKEKVFSAPLPNKKLLLKTGEKKRYIPKAFANRAT